MPVASLVLEPCIWWVNQGKTLEKGLDNHSIWAPLVDKNGHTKSHWKIMEEVRSGDIMINYGDGHVHALSLATSDAYVIPTPADHSYAETDLAKDGRKVDADYWKFNPPISLNSFVEKIEALNILGGPLDKNGEVKQGYFFSFNREGLQILREAANQTWPEWANVNSLSTKKSWVFQGTPSNFDGSGAVRNLEQLTWQVNQQASQIHIGDEVFIWETGGNGGLIAVTMVMTEPEDIALPPEELPYVVAASINLPRRRVWLKVKQVVSPAISRATIRADALLAPVTIFKGWQGTNFPLTSEQVAALHALIAAQSSQTSPTAASFSAISPLETEQSMPSFASLLASLRQMNLHFTEETLSNYLLALQTKRFVILSGISGTGKTKLAIAIAKAYPQKVEVKFSKEERQHDYTTTVKHSHIKYHRIDMPVKLTKNMNLPDNEPGRKSGFIKVLYEGKEAKLRLSEPTSDNIGAYALLFSGDFHTWFDQNLKEGDLFFVDIVRGNEEPDSLRFSLPHTTEVREEFQPTYVSVAVRPDWTDNRGILGYYNPITEKYHRTPCLDLLLRASEEHRKASAENRPAHPFFLILDEMNLARVEHYFSDFLSGLEANEPLHLHDVTSLKAEAESEDVPVPRTLTIPPNLFVIGTVNVDETTSMFSPKVIDRAFTLEFNDVDLIAYGQGLTAPLTGQASPLHLTKLPLPLTFKPFDESNDWQALDPATRATLIQLHQLLSKDNRHFGYRVANEMARFINLAAEQTADPTKSRPQAIDLAILQKVLPKFHGTQQELSKILNDLFSFAVAGDANGSHDFGKWQLSEGLLKSNSSDGSVSLAYPRSAAKLWRMLTRMQEQGFTSFME